MKNQLTFLFFLFLLSNNNLFSKPMPWDDIISPPSPIEIAIRNGNFNAQLISNENDLESAFMHLYGIETSKFQEICDCLLNIYITTYKGSNNSYGKALCQAAKFARVDFVKHLLINFNASIDNKFKVVALTYAAGAHKQYDNSSQDYLEIIKILTTEYGILNGQDELGYTALIKAACYNRTEIVLWLLMNGADTTLTTAYGRSFYTIAHGGPDNKPNPELLAVIEKYNEFLKQRRNIIFNTISNDNGFDQGMPDVLVDLINNY